MKNKKNYILILTIFFFAVFLFVLARSLLYAPTDEIVLEASSQKTLVALAQSKTLSPEQGNPIKKAVAATVRTITTKKVDSPVADSRSPKRLRVPAISVNAGVQDVGITQKGNMSTPNNFTDVGWFKYGAFPGEKGSTVIAGHVDNGLALPAVFGHLENVKIGDDIYIDTVGGKTIHYKVVNSKLYDYNAPAEEVFNQKDASRLKLITCAGTWVPGIRTHDKRLVVNALEVS